MISTYKPNSALPDYELFAFKQQKLQSSGSSQNGGSSKNNGSRYTENEIERMKMCGILFERKPVINQEIFNEFFRKEPCLYNQVCYKNAARIFHCLKADLNENPILKSLKQQQAQERGENTDENQVTEVPKISYESGKEKKNTLQLAFSTLKFQKVLEDLLDECQFYGSYSQFKDDQSLVCTILFDYMMRKFEMRDKLLEEPLDNQDALVTQIENAIHKEKTDLAAELAKNRIKADATTLEELLPKELREVEQHKAELPLYCWVNPLKISVQDMVETLIHTDELKIVEFKKSLDKKCFMIDPHCPNVLMFHYALREKILNSDYVKNYQLIVQDKSSCLAPHTVIKLLSKKDDVIVTNLSGGLVSAFIGCMMEEYEGKVYVYGGANEDKYQEITNKLQLIGCSKFVKLVREDFLEAKSDDPKLENVKVVLINAPCSKSALMNPMEFLFQEGEDVRFLRDYTLDVNSPKKLKKCIQDESALLRHALKFPKCRAIVYQTYSKNSSENEVLISKLLEEFNDGRKSLVFPYKLSPPVIPLTAEDIQNDEVVKNFKYLQFKPSHKMNGSFIALLTRDRDSNVNREMRRAEGGGNKNDKKIKKLSAPQPATFEEKNFLKIAGSPDKQGKMSLPKKLTNLRRKSLGIGAKKSSVTNTYTALEQEIKQLQLRNQLELPLHHQSKRFINSSLSQVDFADSKSKILISNSNNVNSSSIIKSMDPMGFKSRGSDFESKLAQIGKLDTKKMEQLAPNRSSTPDENQSGDQPVQFKQFQFKLNKNKYHINFIKLNILNVTQKKDQSKPLLSPLEYKKKLRVRFKDEDIIEEEDEEDFSEFNDFNSTPNNSFAHSDDDDDDDEEEEDDEDENINSEIDNTSTSVQHSNHNYKTKLTIKNLSSLIMPQNFEESESFKQLQFASKYSSNRKSSTLANEALNKDDSNTINNSPRFYRKYKPMKSNSSNPTNYSYKEFKFDLFQSDQNNLIGILKKDSSSNGIANNVAILPGYYTFNSPKTSIASSKKSTGTDRPKNLSYTNKPFNQIRIDVNSLLPK